MPPSPGPPLSHASDNNNNTISGVRSGVPSAASSQAQPHPQHLRPKSPNRVLAEAEAQWLFTELELANTPSIQDGMTQAEEREIRAKGVNFIVQVGIMLKLPQLTLSTAAVFFQRFLMRASLKAERDRIPRLHHYQSAATALFLATKVEESCRKINELVVAFCRVAQKNPNLVIDQSSKDWWRWRDCILHNEDVLLETLCFDLTIERPHRQLFDMLKWYGIEHNKRLRNAAWSFVTDSNNTQLCLLCNSRTIAAAALYAACKYCDVQLPDDAKGRPWWEVQHVRLRDVRRAVEHMLESYDAATKRINGVLASGSSEGERSIYVGLLSSASTTTLSSSLDNSSDDWNSTRLRDHTQTHDSRSPYPIPGSERRPSSASSTGTKREHEDDDNDNDTSNRGRGVDGPTNGHMHSEGNFNSGAPKRPRMVAPVDSNGSHDLKHHEEELRVENGNRIAEEDVGALPQKGDVAGQGHEADTVMDATADVSEEGELDE